MITKSKMWEDKYVAQIKVQTKLDTGDIDDGWTEHQDIYGAVLYAIDSLGKVQRYYNNEEDYLQSISHLQNSNENNKAVEALERIKEMISNDNIKYLADQIEELIIEYGGKK